MANKTPKMPKETDPEKVKRYNLMSDLAGLILKEPFFSSMSRRIKKIRTDQIDTAGITINKQGFFEMMYNPAFFAALSRQEVQAVIKHEIYHLIFEHVTNTRLNSIHELNHLLDENGRLDPEKFKNDIDAQNYFKIWNIATDLAINSHIDNLPEAGCIPGQGPFSKYPEGKAAEWYFARLREESKDWPKIQVYAGLIDDHSGWGGKGEELDAIAKQNLKGILQEATKEAVRSNSWGTMPEDMRKKILDMLKSTVDWKKVLRWFVQATQRSSKKSTRRRLNKKYPYIHPGKKVERVANIAISIDQSGSVSDELLSKFFGELNKLASIASFTVVPFDTRVEDSLCFVWEKDKSRVPERVMCGGTNFDAPTNWVNEHNFDGHIILTDLEAPAPGPSKCKRMWMTDEVHGENPYFKTNERVVIIKDAPK